MSRVEENHKVCDRWDNLNFTGNSEQVTVRLLTAQINFLEDISKSLAILSDCCLKEWQNNYISEENNGE